LHDASHQRSGCEQRLMLLKGRLLQEEWAIRRASRTLAKQQSALIHLQAVATAARTGDAAADAGSSTCAALDEAVQVGQEAVDAAEAGNSEAAVVEMGLAEMRGPLTSALDELFAAHASLVDSSDFGSGEVAVVKVRECITAIRKLGVARHSASGFPPASRCQLQPDLESLERRCRHLERRCERKATRHALRECLHQLASLESRWTDELHMLEAEECCSAC